MRTKYLASFIAGKVGHLEGQWIQTEFGLAMGFILFPVSSMLVMPKGKGHEEVIQIPTNGKSVLAGYARIILPILAAIFLFVAMGERDVDHPQRFFIALITPVVLGLLYYYFRIHFGKPSEKEVIERTRLGRSIGVYTQPKWIYEDKLYDMAKDARYAYKEKFNSEWKDDIIQPHIPKEKLPLLYALSLFDYMIHPTDEMGNHLNRVDGLYITA